MCAIVSDHTLSGIQSSELDVEMLTLFRSIAPIARNCTCRSAIYVSLLTQVQNLFSFDTDKLCFDLDFHFKQGRHDKKVSGSAVSGTSSHGIGMEVDVEDQKGEDCQIAQQTQIRL